MSQNLTDNNVAMPTEAQSEMQRVEPPGQATCCPGGSINSSETSDIVYRLTSDVDSTTQSMVVDNSVDSWPTAPTPSRHHQKMAARVEDNGPFRGDAPLKMTTVEVVAVVLRRRGIWRRGMRFRWAPRCGISVVNALSSRVVYY